MRYPEFLERLRSTMPSREELKEYGLNQDEVIRVQRAFLFEKRYDVEPLESGSELERMITENDCSTMEVGSVRFLPCPRDHVAGVIVAYCEADPIVVGGDGRVTMYDHASADAGKVDCAINSERFLDALAVFVDIRRSKEEWSGRASEAASKCAELAGGHCSADFFRMLCSFLG